MQLPLFILINIVLIYCVLAVLLKQQATD